LKVIVIGGSGGIGFGLLRQIRSRYPQAELFATRHTSQLAENSPLLAGVQWSQLDATCEDSICAYAAQFDRVHWLISTVGFLHNRDALPEKSLEQIDPEFFPCCLQNILNLHCGTMRQL